MSINYCLPIIKNSKSEVISMIDAYAKDFDYIEVWLDYVKDLDDRFLLKLVSMLEDRLILLFRRQKLEKPVMPASTRYKYLELLKETNSYIDLDIKTQPDELSFIRSNNLHLKLITSYHDYINTPQVNILHETIKTMEEYESEIYKIATYCKNEKDALRLLNIQQMLKDRQKRYIILGMGEAGMVTRIFGALWGNEMVFAPVASGEQSAPGQLTRKQLEKIFYELRLAARV